MFLIKAILGPAPSVRTRRTFNSFNPFYLTSSKELSPCHIFFCDVLSHFENYSNLRHEWSGAHMRDNVRSSAILVHILFSGPQEMLSGSYLWVFVELFKRRQQHKHKLLTSANATPMTSLRLPIVLSPFIIFFLVNVFIF